MFHFYRTSTFLPAQSSAKRASTRRSSSLAFAALMSTMRRISSGARGTPPAFCSTQSSRWALRAMESVPALRVCSRRVGSRSAGGAEGGVGADVVVDVVDVEEEGEGK